jgi:YYY domain-containing protein
VLALPFVLLVLALVLNLLRQGATGSGDAGGWLEPIKRLSPLLPLCIGALGFLNTWDFPIYLVVFVVAYGLAQWGRYGRWSWPFLRDVGVTGATVALAGFLLYLPFYVGFQSQAGGLLPTLYVGTRFRQYFVMFGPFLVAIAGLLVVLVRRLRREQPGTQLWKGWLGWTAAFVLLPLVAMFLIILVLVLTPQGRDLLEGIRRVPAVYEIVGDDSWPVIAGKLLLVKLRYWVMPLVVAGLAALGLVLLKVGLSPHPRPLSPGGREEFSPPLGERLGEGGIGSPSLQFALLCAVAGLLLTLSVEYFYLVDNFRVRMNTIFKFYFQGWVLMALASAFAVYWLSRQRGGLRRAFLVGFWLLFAMGLVYPVLGNYSRAGSFQPEPTLDGTAYLASSQPDDYAAIQWLNENVADAPVILETPGSGGKSYVYEGRVSALTGLPTLLGWAGHEGQWRGDYTVQSARDPDIETIYNTFDVQAARALLEQYDVTYVYVGPLERSTYDPRGLEKLGRFMDVVYQNDGVTIYEIRK